MLFKLLKLIKDQLLKPERRKKKRGFLETVGANPKKAIGGAIGAGLAGGDAVGKAINEGKIYIKDRKLHINMRNK